MRRWIIVALIALAVLWFILTNVGAYTALADFAARPILALTQADRRIPVQQPGLPAAEGEACAVGGQGAAFGHRFTFALPDGDLVTCTHRFRSIACDGGWTADRAAAN